MKENTYFFITSRSVFLRLRNIWDKRCRENQNTYFVLNSVFSPKIVLFMRYLLTCFLPSFLTYLLTYSMQQSPTWEAKRFSASQKNPWILLNPKVHYHSHKCPPPVPVLSQLDPVHTPSSNFLKIHLNIILPSTPGSPKWSPTFRFPHQKPVHASPLNHTRYMPRPSHSSRFYHPKNIGWGALFRR